MPTPELDFQPIQEQVSSILSDAKARLLKTKNEERTIRLRINQLERQLVIAQDALKDAQNQLIDAEGTNTAKQAEIALKMANAQDELDTILNDLEPARRRYETLQEQIEAAENTIRTYDSQKKAIEADIKTLETQRDTLAQELDEATRSKKTVLDNLAAEIARRSGELSAFDVRQEMALTEHERSVELLVAQEKTIQANIKELASQELEYIDRNGELQEQIAAREAEVQTIMANLKRRENELDARERVVTNKERSITTRQRRNLT
jgi:chromosome segregation ATPase